MVVKLWPTCAQNALSKASRPLARSAVAERVHLLQQIGMRADRALPEHDQIAGQDIGALDGDADRHRTIEIADVILRAVDHRLAAMDVHGVVDRDPHPLGGVQLHDPGNHRGMMALVERRAGQPPRRVEQIGGAGDARERLLDAFELADGDAELLADAGIGAGGARGIGRARGRQRRQRNAAAGGERRHQHLPALAEPLLPADDVVHRNEDVACPSSGRSGTPASPADGDGRSRRRADASGSAPR